MYRIVFYVDKKGKSSILSYMAELESVGGKDSRIKLMNLRKYIKALSENGTRLPDRYVKHLDGEIWELRPLRDRILFASWVENSFILLHVFMKKTQKTPKREIEKAKRELEEIKERRKEK